MGCVSGSNYKLRLMAIHQHRYMYMYTVYTCARMLRHRKTGVTQQLNGCLANQSLRAHTCTVEPHVMVISVRQSPGTYRSLSRVPLSTLHSVH